MRDDFSLAVQRILAERAGFLCSREGCEQPTSGPRTDPEKSINVGVAAHITAASPGGPRYDPTLTPEQRRSAENGIWLCQTCAKLADNDEARYPTTLLHSWKARAELKALLRLEARRPDISLGPFERLQLLIPDFLTEMSGDLTRSPLDREFVLLKRSWSYSGRSCEFAYYYDDHPKLDSIVRILQNFGFIYEITAGNVKRFAIAEELADYLRTRSTEPPLGNSNSRYP
jgi:hypothetical protein